MSFFQATRTATAIVVVAFVVPNARCCHVVPPTITLAHHPYNCMERCQPLLLVDGIFVIEHADSRCRQSTLRMLCLSRATFRASSFASVKELRPPLDAGLDTG